MRAMIVEALYSRHGTIEAQEFDSVAEATGFLDEQSDRGSCYAIGVLVDGEPCVASPYVDPHPPSAHERAAMLDDYGVGRRGWF